MTEEKPKQIEINCPNCLSPAIKEGNKIICETCDATFTFNKTGGAKVLEIGRLDSLTKRMDAIESLILPHESKPESEPKQTDEPEESSILGD